MTVYNFDYRYVPERLNRLRPPFFDTFSSATYFNDYCSEGWIYHTGAENTWWLPGSGQSFTNAADSEVLIKYKVVKKPTESSLTAGPVSIGFRRSASTQYTAGYIIGIGRSTNYRNLYIAQSTTSSSIAVLSNLTTALPEDANNGIDRWIYIRGRVNGSNMYAKTWYADEPEPAAWQITASNTTYKSGYTTIGNVTYTSSAIVQYISFATNGDTAVLQPTEKRIISGILKSPDNQPVANTKVHLSFYDTNVPVSYTTTNADGEYIFTDAFEPTAKFRVSASPDNPLYGYVHKGVYSRQIEPKLLSDTYYNNVLFYAPFLNDFNNKSIKKVVVPTVVGNATIVNEPGPAGTGFLKLDANSYLKMKLNALFQEQSFTIETYLKGAVSADTSYGFFSVESGNDQDNALTTLLQTDNGLFYSDDALTWKSSFIPGTTFADGNWHHFAMVKSGTAVTIFKDGALVATIESIESVIQKGSYLYIGTKSNANINLENYFQHFRITKGIARYTAAFTPPTF